VSDEELGIRLFFLLESSQIDGFEFLLSKVGELVVCYAVVSSDEHVVVLDFGVIWFVVLESDFILVSTVFHAVL